MDERVCDICGKKIEFVSSILTRANPDGKTTVKICKNCTHALTMFLKARSNKEAP